MKYLRFFENNKIDWDNWNEEEYSDIYSYKKLENINYKDFNIGDRVMCSFYKGGIEYNNEKGIVYRNEGILGIYFDNNIDGHNDALYYFNDYDLENRHSWNFSKRVTYNLKIKKMNR